MEREKTRILREEEMRMMKIYITGKNELVSGESGPLVLPQGT